MASLRAVAGPLLASGLRLAGVRVDEASTPAEAASVLDRVAANPGTGVILVQQDWYEQLGEPQRQALERAALPIIVPVPAPDWSGTRGGAQAYILDLLQRAIGYRVRLQ